MRVLITGATGLAGSHLVDLAPAPEGDVIGSAVRWRRPLPVGG